MNWALLMTAYLRPTTLSEAVALLATTSPRLLAGGTDLYPGTQNANLAGPILDLTGVPDLTGIQQTADGLQIGACTTWADLAGAALPPALQALQQAASEVGGVQIQNAGTLGGNLCNASPAADGVPPLLIVDARVTLVSTRGTRRLPLADFLTGPRQTARRPDEVLTAVTIPSAALVGQSCFLKLGARAYLVISIAMVAARLETRNGRITAAAVSVGACSATARRLLAVEAALIGVTPEQGPSRVTEATVAAHLSPVDDLRATAAYRLCAATELLRRAVAHLAKASA